jgi:hypothetical protein
MPTRTYSNGIQLNNQNGFLSTGRTGTGSQETIPHGLGVAPAFTHIICLDVITAAPVVVTADATNCYVTVTTGQVYSIWAPVARD